MERSGMYTKARTRLLGTGLLALAMSIGSEAMASPIAELDGFSSSGTLGLTDNNVSLLGGQE